MITITDRNISDISHQKQKPRFLYIAHEQNCSTLRKQMFVLRSIVMKEAKPQKTEKNLDLGIES